MNKVGLYNIQSDSIVNFYQIEGEPVNGVDQISKDRNNLLFCTNDDLVMLWDSRTGENNGAVKFNFRGSNPQDIKSSPRNPYEFAVCDDRNCFYVDSVLI